MADKKLQVTFDAKMRTTEVERSLKRLEKEGIKISKALQGFSIDTKGGQGGFAKSLLTVTKGMQKFKGVTEDTAKVMRNVYNRELERKTKLHDIATRQLEKLNRLHKEQTALMQKSKAQGQNYWAGVHGQNATRIENLIAGKEYERQNRASDLNDFRGGQPPRMTATEKVTIAAVAADVVANMMKQGGVLVQGLKNLELGNVSSIMQMGAGSLIQQTLSGDFSRVFAGNRARGGHFGKSHFLQKQNPYATLVGNGQILEDADGLKAPIASGAGTVFSNATGVVTSFLGLKGAMQGKIGDVSQGIRQGADVGSGIMNTVGAGADLFSGGPQKMQLDSVTSADQARINADPMSRAIAANLSATAQARLMASRRLGGSAMDAMFTGGAYGLSQVESANMGMGIADRFGAGSAMDIMHGSLALERKGVNRDLASQVIGGTMLGGGSAAAGQEALTRVIAKGVELGWGKSSLQFGEKLAGAISSGLVSTTGGRLQGSGDFENLLMAGLKNPTSQDIDQRLGAVGAFDAMKDNPQMMSQRLARARQALGSDASGFLVQALAQQSQQALMADKNELLDPFMSADQRKAFARGNMEDPFRALLAGSGDDPLVQQMKEGVSKMGMEKYLQSSQGKSVAALLLNSGTNEFSNATLAIGGAGLAGGGKVAGGTSPLNDIGDSHALTQLTVVAKAHLHLLEEENKMRIDVNTAMRAQLNAFKEAGMIDATTFAAKEFTDVLKRLTAAIDGAVHHINRGGGRRKMGP
jgi:hypothetical protein